MAVTARVAILIDGGYFLKRLPHVQPNIDEANPREAARAIRQLVRSHLDQVAKVHGAPDSRQLLYRCFYYDARPYADKAHRAISNRAIDYAKSDPATFRHDLFDVLRGQPNLALRLGHVIRPPGSSWILKPKRQVRLLKGDIDVSDLDDSDFDLPLRQKGVDMRIGLDIATITLKKQANVIVLVSGDSDFVPAAKLARREGVTFILDPLWQNISRDLYEHIDGLTSGFPRPQRGACPSELED